MTEPINLDSAIAAVRAERDRQDRLHPRDDWPLHPNPGGALACHVRRMMQMSNNTKEKNGGLGLTWADLLEEELAKACAETDPHAQAEELLQLAALAIRAACALTRKEEGR